MKKRYSELLKKSFDEDAGIYFFITLFFAIGIAAGAFTIKGLQQSQIEGLVMYFNRFLQIMDKQKINGPSIFMKSINNNLQTILLVWFFGITIIGVPATIIVIAFRGFMLGFTVSFLVQGMGFKGVFVTLVALIPQNLIYMPCLLAASYQSMNFSLNIIKSRIKSAHENSFKKNILRYSSIIGIIYMIMCIGSLIEAYVSPSILKAMATYLTTQ